MGMVTKMTELNRNILTKIIDSNYPTEVKVEEIMSLYELDRHNLLNNVSNRIREDIDVMKYGEGG